MVVSVVLIGLQCGPITGAPITVMSVLAVVLLEGLLVVDLGGQLVANANYAYIHLKEMASVGLRSQSIGLRTPRVGLRSQSIGLRTPREPCVVIVYVRCSWLSAVLHFAVLELASLLYCWRTENWLRCRDVITYIAWIFIVLTTWKLYGNNVCRVVV